MNEETFIEAPTDGFALHLKTTGVMRQWPEQTEIKGLAVTKLTKIKQN